MVVELDAGRLEIRKLIAHEIPHRRKADELGDIPLSEVVPPLADETLEFFRRRLARTLGKKGQAVETNERLESPPLPPIVADWLEGRIRLVKTSQLAARHLYAVQDGTNSPGLLVVASARAMGNKAIALLKLEEEEGVEVESSMVDGRPTINVIVHDNLMLTDNTRVFKAAVFWFDGNRLVGSVSDEQQGQPIDIAGFFLNDFLGVRLQRKPSVVTRSFHNTVIDFINEEVADPEVKMTYRSALFSELASNRNTIDTVQFINDYVREEHQAELRQVLTAADIPRSFRKDTASVGRASKRSEYRTSGDIRISGPAEQMDELVSIEELNGRSVLVIRDTVEKVR